MDRSEFYASTTTRTLRRDIEETFEDAKLARSTKGNLTYTVLFQQHAALQVRYLTRKLHLLPHTEAAVESIQKQIMFWRDEARRWEREAYKAWNTTAAE